MFTDPDTDPRVEPPTQGDERATLVGFLRWQRDTLELKCAGLDADNLARRSVEPSTLSLLGLVRHIAEVERGWFRRVMAGQDAPPHFYTDTDPDGDFDGAVPDPALVAKAWDTWRAEVAALGTGAHGGGVCPPQRSRRPAASADRRGGGSVAVEHRSRADGLSPNPVAARGSGELQDVVFVGLAGIESTSNRILKCGSMRITFFRTRPKRTAQQVRRRYCRIPTGISCAGVSLGGGAAWLAVGKEASLESVAGRLPTGRRIRVAAVRLLGVPSPSDPGRRR